MCTTSVHWLNIICTISVHPLRYLVGAILNCCVQCFTKYFFTQDDECEKECPPLHTRCTAAVHGRHKQSSLHVSAPRIREVVPRQDIQCVPTLSLTIRVYLHSFSCFCLPNLRNPAKIFRKFELIAVQGHPRSSIFDLSKAHILVSNFVYVSPTVLIEILTHLARK